MTICKADQIRIEDADFVISKLHSEEIQKLANSHILITGAAGFLPGAIVDTLARLNDTKLKKTPLRLSLLGRSDAALFARHSMIANNNFVQFIIQDVTAPLQILEKIDYVIHAASAAAPKGFMKDPVGVIAANTAGLDMLMERARNDKSSGILYFSSSEVYGALLPEQIPTSEKESAAMDWQLPRAVYGVAKRTGEACALAWHRQYQLPVKIVRPFHIHGPGLDINDGRIVGEMVRQGLEGADFKLESDGTATRTYGYVADATTGFIKALLSGKNGHIYNIGTDTPETSIRELAQEIADILGRKDAVRTAPLSPESGSPNRACPDITRMKEELGHTPAFSLREGLSRTIAWNKAMRDKVHQSLAPLGNFQPVRTRPSVPSISVLLKKYEAGELDRDLFWEMMQTHHYSIAESQILMRNQVDSIVIENDSAFVKLKNNLCFSLNASDPRGAAAHVLNHGTYEAGELAVFKAAARSVKGCFIDIGANVGWYCLHGALEKNLVQHGIMAFEPVPATYAFLQKNIQKSGLTKVINSFAIAVGEKQGTLTLHVPEKTGSVAASAKPLFPDQKNAVYDVPVETLDDILLRHPVPNVGLIKADIEGAEIFALKGARNTIENHKPVLMLELLRKWAAVYGYHPNDVFNLLAGIGYEAYGISHDKLVKVERMTEATIETNFVFLIPHLHAETLKAIQSSLQEVKNHG